MYSTKGLILKGDLDFEDFDVSYRYLTNNDDHLVVPEITLKIKDDKKAMYEVRYKNFAKRNRNRIKHLEDQLIRTKKELEELKKEYRILSLEEELRKLKSIK